MREQQHFIFLIYVLVFLSFYSYSQNQNQSHAIQSNIDGTTAANMMANVGHQQVTQPQGTVQ